MFYHKIFKSFITTLAIVISQGAVFVTLTGAQNSFASPSNREPQSQLAISSHHKKYHSFHDQIQEKDIPALPWTLRIPQAFQTYPPQSGVRSIYEHTFHNKTGNNFLHITLQLYEGDYDLNFVYKDPQIFSLPGFKKEWRECMLKILQILSPKDEAQRDSIFLRIKKHTHDHQASIRTVESGDFLEIPNHYNHGFACDEICISNDDPAQFSINAFTFSDQPKETDQLLVKLFNRLFSNALKRKVYLALLQACETPFLAANDEKIHNFFRHIHRLWDYDIPLTIYLSRLVISETPHEQAIGLGISEKILQTFFEVDQFIHQKCLKLGLQ